MGVGEKFFLKAIFTVTIAATVVIWIAIVWRYQNVIAHCSATNEVRTVLRPSMAGKVLFPFMVKQRKYICPGQSIEVWQ